MSYALFREGQIWHYRFRVAGQPRVQRSTRETNRAKADQVASEAYTAAVLRARGDEPCPTLRKVVQLWLDAHALVHSEAHRKTVEIFGRLHLHNLGELPLTEIFTGHVEAARAQHLEDHSPSSANQWLTILRLLFIWAIRRRMLRIREWDVKPIKIQKRPRTMLPVARTMPWLDAVDQVTKGTMRRAIRLALGLGLREEEAQGARWEWLDFARGLYTPGKTKAREALPLTVPQWLLDYLRALAQPNGLIAPSKNGQAFTPGAMRQIMHKANRVAGTPGLTPHRLRGTYATLLSENGVPVQDIKRALRHKKLETTLGYLEESQERVKRGQVSIAASTKLGRRENEHVCS